MINLFKKEGVIDKMNSWEYKANFQQLNYKPKEDVLYVSIDVNEANWSVLKYT